MNIEKMKEIFERYRTWTTKEEYDEIEKMMNENKQTQVYPNDYIHIEYHNEIGEYKAYLLVQLFDKQKEFYQYFLKKFDKIVISNNYEEEDSKVLAVHNRPVEIDYHELIIKMFGLKYSGYLYEKLMNGENLLTTEDVLSFLKGKMLRDSVANNEIDFFKYLDLMNGLFVNHEVIYDEAIIDLAFYYNQPTIYEILDKYMHQENVEEIKTQIYYSLHQFYGLELLNNALSHQEKLLLRYSNNGDSFLKENVEPLSHLFTNQVQKIINKHTSSKLKEKKKVDRETTLKLTFEFLSKIDPSGKLASELEENLENGKIILWNPNDLEKRKEMQAKYYEHFNIDCQMCYYESKTKTLVLNLPLEYCLDDVVSLVHEFFHLHSILDKLEPSKNRALAEFPSIYFEMLASQFLIEKGFSKEELSLNFRIVDSAYNYKIVAPIMQFLIQYHTKGKIDYEYIQTLIEETLDAHIIYYKSVGMTEEEIKNEFEKLGYNKSKEEIAFNMVYDLNYLLVKYDESVLDRYPYLLGTILANKAIEDKVSPTEIIKISDIQRTIENPNKILEQFGIYLNSLDNTKENTRIYN